MKCLFLSAKRYSLNNSVVKGFADNGWDIRVLDYRDFFKAGINRFVDKFESLPNKIKKHWKNGYIERINRGYLHVFREYRPDLVFIYNNQNILPETLLEMKKKSKIAFMLGDNPLYTPTNRYNLHILFFSDYTISPDSFWAEQLRIMGVKNVCFDCLGFDPETYFPYQPVKEDRDQYGSDIVYVGSAHKSNWGYKRYLFLNQFKDFDLKAFLSGERDSRLWSRFFPDLEKRIVPHHEFNPAFNNKVYNCSKIAPVEMVPALFHGVHIRVFDILGAGIFPLCEYSRDLDMIFGRLGVPWIKDYNDAAGIALDLLKAKSERMGLVEKMRTTAADRFNPKHVVERMLTHIGMKA